MSEESVVAFRYIGTLSARARARFFELNHVDAIVYERVVAKKQHTL
jgi:hypothetical protein